MKQTKGIVKQCPKCKQPMSLLEFRNIPTLWWVCWKCPELINYQSVGASELKEVRVV